MMAVRVVWRRWRWHRTTLPLFWASLEPQVYATLADNTVCPLASPMAKLESKVPSIQPNKEIHGLFRK